MKDKKNWAWILFFGSLWGISEVAGGGFLYANDIPHSSIFLAAWAVFILAVARGLINIPGSSTAIGAVATLFKLVNASPFICHLLGIFLLGVGFDLAASLLLKKGRKAGIRSVLTGIAGTYGGYALFAFIITYIIRYEFWVEGGLSKVLNHIFVSGSLAALAAAALVPLGILAGSGSRAITGKQPRWLYAGAMTAVVVIWVLGQFVG